MLKGVWSIHIGHWMNLSGVPVLFYPVMVITYVTIRPDSEPFQIRLVHVVKNFIAMQFGGQRMRIQSTVETG